MNETSWDDSRAMLSHENMSSIRQNYISKDDAGVSYFFHRPEELNDPGNYANKKWAAGDDSVIEQSRGITVQELERNFHTMAIDTKPPKKLWDIGSGGDYRKSDVVMFRKSPWNQQHDNVVWNHNLPPDHHVSQAMPTNYLPSLLRRPGSFPGTSLVTIDSSSMLSSRTESGSLDVSVLGGRPPSVPGSKSMTLRQTMSHYNMHKKKVGQIDTSEIDPSKMDNKDQISLPYEKVEIEGAVEGQEPLQASGIMEKPGVYGCRGGSPRDLSTSGNKHSYMSKDNDYINQQAQIPQQRVGFQLDASQFARMSEPISIDSSQFDYSSQLGQMPSMDSPNFNMDFGQQMRQQPIALLTQQQYAMPPQLGMNGVRPAGSYMLSQDPYTVGIQLSGPVIHPQYYGVEAPWGIYPVANIIQAQNQQAPQALPQIGGPSGHLTPSGLSDSGSQIQQIPTQGAQYQILAPAFYHQNGQFLMSNHRGLPGGPPMRLVSPAPPVLVTGGNQQSMTGGAPNLGSNLLRPLTTQPQQMHTTPPIYSSGNNNPQHSLGYNQSSNVGFTQASSSFFAPISNGFNQQGNYGNKGLSSLGSSMHSSFGSVEAFSFGNGQRHDSFDHKDMVPISQYYGSLGSPAGAMGLLQHTQPMTSPLSGLNPGGRLCNTALGAEAKSWTGSIGATNVSMLPDRTMQSRSSLCKEVTGCSHLLEDFRNNHIPNLQLQDLMNHVVEFSQDQHGSRFIQQKLERATPQEKLMVFNEILSSAYSLMTDVFGNYVIQKLFEFGAPEQKQILAQRLRGHVLPLALQMYGCRVIQKALESISADMQVEIVKELDGHVAKCVKDQNGNHVVQKCIECVDSKHLLFIINAFKGQVYTLSTHPYGCRVIQRILEHCTHDQIQPLLEELHQHTEHLVLDQYGNYVIQHVLEHGRPEDKSKIVGGLRGQVLMLSQHKFASNVVEKCVSNSSRVEKAALIEEVCGMNDGALYTMMKDQFANYVIQKMIDVAELPQGKILMHKIRPHVSTLRKYTYGKHILVKLEKFFLKTSNMGSIGMAPNGTLLP